MIIGKVLIVIEVIRAARALIKDTQKDLSDINKAIKAPDPKGAIDLLQKAGVSGKATKKNCRRALVRKKMKEYNG